MYNFVFICKTYMRGSDSKMPSNWFKRQTVSSSEYEICSFMSSKLQTQSALRNQISSANCSLAEKLLEILREKVVFENISENKWRPTYCLTCLWGLKPAEKITRYSNGADLFRFNLSLRLRSSVTASSLRTEKVILIPRSDPTRSKR